MNDTLAQIEKLIQEFAPELEAMNVVEAIREVLTARQKSGEATAQTDLQDAFLCLEFWVHDGRFYVGNSEPQVEGIGVTETLNQRIHSHFPNFRKYSGPEQVIGDWEQKVTRERADRLY